MKQRNLKLKPDQRDKFLFAGLLALACLFTGSAVAQDYRTLQGTNLRDGRATVQPSTAVAENVWNNAGRGFLRWWDPIFESGTTIDNDEPGTFDVPAGTWINPAPGGLLSPSIVLASFYIQSVAGVPPYRTAVTATTGGLASNPTAGSTATYEWRLGGLIAGDAYAVEVNLPIGPTNIVPAGPPDIRFPCRYQLYEVIDANGSTAHWVDLNAEGGGWARINGTNTFTADGAGQIRVILHNVVRKNDFGTPIEPTDAPGVDLVYADTAQAIGSVNTIAGAYQASPVVGQLTQTPFIGGPIQFNQRVVTARNETAYVSTIDKDLSIGVVTSFTHNGQLVNGATPLRRNMVWSWPAVRPFDFAQSTVDNYVVERQNWIMGAPNSNYPRYEILRQSDNLTGTTTLSGPFVAANTFNSVGPDYLTTPASSTLGGDVTWRPNALDGNYFIEVHLPNNDAVTDHARGARYQILQGATVIQTIVLDQSVSSNWIRLPNQPVDGYVHTSTAPISVRLLNQSLLPADITDGRAIYADAIRFVGDADLSINSTPIQVVARVHDGTSVAPRDVVVVARENGRLYCMDAHGDPSTGQQPRVYWTWPSENPAADPNNVPAIDHGIAEVPTKFDLSSAAIATVGGEEVLFIGAENGRVYAINMDGRGDGTTDRRWTYPDDYNPSAPTTPMGISNLGPITGSVAVADIGGAPHVLIPASSGRLIAVDANGNPATKTTSMLWQYPASPAVLGSLEMSPVVSGNRVFIAAADPVVSTEGVIHAVDLLTGNPLWTRATRLDGITPFGLFGSASPLVLPASIAGSDLVYFVDNGGYLTALQQATGTVAWEEFSVPGGSRAGLSFSYMRTFNAAGTFLVDDVPTVLVASTSGALRGFYADGSVNLAGNRINWGYSTEFRNQVASFAVGGWPNAAGLLANRTHLYIGDSGGFLYAFSSEDDTNSVPPITPGVRPGQWQTSPSDPSQQALNDMIQRDDVLLLSPEDFLNIRNLLFSTGGATYADLVAARGRAIQRRDFEFGETLYLMVMNINDTTVANTAGYFVSAELSSGNRTTSEQRLPVSNVSGAPTAEQGGVALGAISILPNSRNSVVPGTAMLTVSAVIGSSSRSGISGTDVHLAAPTVPVPFQDIRLANPLGVRFLNTEAGVTTNPSDPLVIGNNPVGYTGAGLAPWNRWLYPTDTPPVAAAAYPGRQLGDQVNTTDPVPHNARANGRMLVYDRSLMILLQKTGGMGNVKVNSQDLTFQPTSRANLNDPFGLGISKPLDPVLYAGFEDYPNQYPNRSFDYPDLRKFGVNITKELFGTSENPLFGPVSLRGPSVVPGDLTTYQTPAGYEAGLNRSLQSTEFAIQWDVPKYQPATVTSAARPFGYAGMLSVFVESGTAAGWDNNDAYRQFSLAVTVSQDERLSTTTKTVDLGSVPAGGGFINPALGPERPWIAGSGFRPWINIPQSPTQFQQFSVFNDGNVNMLNVRVAKAFGTQVNPILQVERTLELYSPGGHELSWIDGAWNLVSDLDPTLSPTARAGADPAGRIVLQKARPGDIASTRLSTNPRRRANPRLFVTSGNLLSASTYVPGDPFVGVAPPIGSPVGTYLRQVYAFEDYANVGNINDPFPGGGSVPSLGTYLDLSSGQTVREPFIDPGFTLKFNVRETRLTNRATPKSAPMVDNLHNGVDPFAWANQQPTAVRLTSGSMFTAWSSNRLNAGLIPDFLAMTKTQGQAGLQDQWRIYVAGLPGTTPVANPNGSPVNDFNGWGANSASNWFVRSLLFPAPGGWQTWFTLNTGETLATPGVESSGRFMNPVFSTSGSVNPMIDPNSGRSSFGNQYMAFVGQTNKRDASGQISTLSQVMMADLTLNPAGSVSLNSVVALPGDTSTIKGKPSLVQWDNGAGRTGTVFYVGQANGLGDLYTADFRNGSWTPVTKLNLGDQFENLGAPSVTMRRYRNTNEPIMDVYFTGKVRGRSVAEAFRGQIIGVGGAAQPNPWRTQVDRYDRLDYDAASGVFWAPGVSWRLTDADVNNFRVYIQVGGTLQPLMDLATWASTRKLDRQAQELVFDTNRGGQCFVDASRGSVKFSGVILPRNAQIFIRYSPRFVRVSGNTTAFVVDDGGSQRIARSNTSSGANYRNANAVFDDRHIGVFTHPDPTRQNQNLTSDLNFWFNPAGLTPLPLDLIRHDRFTVAFNRTSATGADATRPYMTTLRFGVDLPTPVAVTNTGAVVNFQVTSGMVPGSFYQIDPAAGKVYFSSEMEDRAVTISYTGVSGNNVTLNLTLGATVGLINESGEEAVPIEQVGNESDLFMTVDPINPIGGPRRPPTIWMIWSSGRTGTTDIYFQTIARKSAPQLPLP
ncbi:PQQ-binding-like beta-propeller repeat protein [Kamptonema cortianum]|nr:PQQ-binding-like beta-propeller repeat protein [Kamptonema cortianum]